MKRRRSTGGAVPKDFQRGGCDCEIVRENAQLWLARQHWGSPIARATYEKDASHFVNSGAVCVQYSLVFFTFLFHTETHTHTDSVALITPPPSQLARPTPLLAFVRQPPLSFWPSRLRHPHHLPSSITQGRQLTYALLSRVW